ncbi:hypothetical protein [Cellulosilyticum sp. I15G10I2]|uniref:hypothetical protein n=1 Tax=Cellulosilyticum sp. I15G10I2 TaxID=1892843 RepID=UPI00085CAD6C|nr:hypothetical protein [Cellulosilyticum sp. I15G10I2]
MKKFLVVMVCALFITGCGKRDLVTYEIQEYPVAVETTKEIKDEATSEEIMKRVETSVLEESVPIPDNFPISYVPIIDGAQIIQGESKIEADKTIFNVIQRVNLVPEDAYNYYNEIYADSPSYVISNAKEDETITVERIKNGLNATLRFISDEEGKSKVIIQAVIIN